MIRIAAGVLVLIAGAGVWTAWRIAPEDRTIPPLEDVSREDISGVPEAQVPSLDSLGDAIVHRNPFSPSRRPAAISWLDHDEALAPIPPSPRPNLRLTGVINGAAPAAVIDGVPGAPAGMVMTPGDTVHGLVLETIVGDTVRVMGADTTWILILRQPSK